MNISEFKIWLDGYSQSFKNGKPSKKQWAVVQEKLLSVKDKSPNYIPSSPKPLPYKPKGWGDERIKGPLNPVKVWFSAGSPSCGIDAESFKTKVIC